MACFPHVLQPTGSKEVHRFNVILRCVSMREIPYLWRTPGDAPAGRPGWLCATSIRGADLSLAFAAHQIAKVRPGLTGVLLLP